VESDITLELTVALSRVCSEGRRSLALLLSVVCRESLYMIGLGGRSWEADPRKDGPVWAFCRDAVISCPLDAEERRI